MAGWMHGVWWRYALTQRMWEVLHITTTELCTVAINLIQYHPLMPEDAEVALWTDALVPEKVLPKLHAKSNMLHAVLHADVKTAASIP